MKHLEVVVGQADKVTNVKGKLPLDSKSEKRLKMLVEKQDSSDNDSKKQKKIIFRPRNEYPKVSNIN